MKAAVRETLSKSIVASAEALGNTEAQENFLKTGHGQAILVSSQQLWTSQVEKAL